ncbi:MAG: cytochrome c3 family protein [Anaerolinea sp.]|nr:cytochrome c3 family protein [Anaerolinea sp.]
MKKFQVLTIIGTLFLVVGFALIAQTSVLAQDTAPTPPEPLENPPYLADYYNAWVASPHADFTAEAFRHWDSEGEIPENCAKCHSTPGYLDYMGADGSEFGSVDAPAELGSLVTCDACHDPIARDLTTVQFPSGAVVEDGTDATRCMQCHQGRASTDSVNARLTELALVESPDTVNPELGFINIHYYAAAASLYGSEARGGYQYDGQIYQMRNNHVPGFDTCSDCHNPHSLEINVELCADCHEDVESVEDLQFIRMNGSLSDYDGDEDINEGIAEEIAGLQEILYESIQTYATEISGVGIVYESHSHPYWFIDGNGNGEVDEGEVSGDTRYNAFTANLLRAAYNYQVVAKDPGGYAHNPQYMIHLLYDSIESLSVALQTEVEGIVRNDPGHFNISAEAFRHWDAEGEVPATCARCHSETGLPVWIENGSNIAEPISNSLNCSTCHDSVQDFTLFELEAATFPSGAVLSFAPEGEADDNNLCLACHQGRESTVSVNNAIRRANVGDDEVAQGLSFRNVHYFAAGATLFGSEAMGAYQYEGMEYNGRNYHDGEDEAGTCVDCHDAHTGERDIELCADCHDDVEESEDTRLIRVTDDVELIDYDGDGDAEEPIRDEIMSFEDALLVAIQAYANETVGTAIAYDSHSHPYWFIDTNGNGVADPEEVNGDNRFTTWTPNLLRAAYNYQYIQKDPGVYAHNPDYAMQVLYDSLNSIGGADAVATFTRPPVAPPAE